MTSESTTWTQIETTVTDATFDTITNHDLAGVPSADGGTSQFNLVTLYTTVV
jgi:hypothetical protein